MAEAVVVQQRESVALARIDPQALIAEAIKAGAGIDTMERLVALAKDVRTVQAREAWYAAMAEFQRQCPTIKKTGKASIRMRSGGTFTYKYAPLDEIMTTIQPVMGPLGLSVSWRSRFEPGQVIVSCRISHTLGHHEESGDVAMPVVQAEGADGANPAQRVGIASTYAKRYALLGIIGMAPEDDDDAGSQEQGAQPPVEQGAGAADSGAIISDGQQKRLWAIAREHTWDQTQVKDLLTSFGRDHTKDLLRSEYDRFIERLKAGPKA